MSRDAATVAAAVPTPAGSDPPARPVRDGRPRGLRRRSLAVSLATTALDAGLFALGTLLLAGPALVAARWASGAVGAAANFALNRSWAFRGPGGHTIRQAARYAAVAVAAVSLATLLWWGLHAATGRDPRLLHLVSLAAVWLVFTFPMLRRWVFRERTSPDRRRN